MERIVEYEIVNKVQVGSLEGMNRVRREPLNMDSDSK